MRKKGNLRAQSGAWPRKKTGKAYSNGDIELFLGKYEGCDLRTIFEKEAKRAAAVVATIRDKGVDEKNRLKAANSMLDRVMPRVERHEIGGSLQLESRLLEALSKAEKLKEER